MCSILLERVATELINLENIVFKSTLQYEISKYFVDKLSTEWKHALGYLSELGLRIKSTSTVAFYSKTVCNTISIYRN